MHNQASGSFKTVLRWKFITLHAYIKVSERAQIHIATQTQTQEMVRNKKKIRARLHETGTKKAMQRINDLKSWFFEKINNN